MTPIAELLRLILTDKASLTRLPKKGEGNLHWRLYKAARRRGYLWTFANDGKHLVIRKYWVVS